MNKATPIVLTSQNGNGTKRLVPSALQLAEEAEEEALASGQTKRGMMRTVLARRISEAGYETTEEALRDAAQDMQKVRRGEELDAISISANRTANANPVSHSNSAPDFDSDHFEATRAYPDDGSRAWYESLVGLDDKKRSLLLELEILLYPDRVEAWAQRHHGQQLQAAQELARRVPLAVFQGDVGTGKTALAETVGDALVRRISRVNGSAEQHAYLLKLNTQVRGSGLVGEMTGLVSSAFDDAEAFAAEHPSAPVLLLIDEADALASSRATDEMHHEDRAGLNTLIQRLDNLRLSQGRLATLFITNRPEALDPAIKRRAALVLDFERPTDEARRKLISDNIATAVDMSEEEVDELVRLSGADGSQNGNLPFTASDLTDRLFPEAIRAAFSEDRPLCFEDMREAIRSIEPSPRFGS